MYTTGTAEEEGLVYDTRDYGGGGAGRVVYDENM